ncbi:peptide deformylase [Candidatus Latescibacterota bacterium]
MEYKIKTLGDPVLKKGTEEVSAFNDELAEIVENMIDTMYRDNGIGLAAPQVGISKKIIVVDPTFGDDENALRDMINPEIIETGDECELEEGCLSIPGVFEFITRPEKITAKYQDVDGTEHRLEADGLLARVIQHEIDHLEGILFIDRLSTVKRNLLAKTLREIEEEGNEG